MVEGKVSNCIVYIQGFRLRDNKYSMYLFETTVILETRQYALPRASPSRFAGLWSSMERFVGRSTDSVNIVMNTVSMSHSFQCIGITNVIAYF